MGKKDPWKFGIGSEMTVRLACMDRKGLEKALHYAFVLKDIRKADAALQNARCYRVRILGRVTTIGKKFGKWRVYEVQFPNGGKAWTFGPDYLRKATDVNG